MEELVKKIEDYRKEINAFNVSGNDTAESFRIKYLGTKGLIKSVMTEIKNVPVENKKAFGQIINDLKLFAENKYEELKGSTSSIERQASNIDLSLPGDEMTVLATSRRLSIRPARTRDPDWSGSRESPHLRPEERLL